MATPSSWSQAVIDRMDNDTLVAMTNDDSETQDPAPTVNATRLSAAIDDASAEYAVIAGVAPQLTDPFDVSTIVLGVLMVLCRSKVGFQEKWRAYEEDFFRKATKRRTISTSAPGTTNTGDNALTPSNEAPNNRVVRPDADRAHYRGYLPYSRGGERKFPGEW